MWETDSNVFTDDIIKSVLIKYDDIDKQVEGKGFSFLVSWDIKVQQ